MKKTFQIVPIIIATQKPSTCKKIADVLRPYFNSSNLFIISTDFSHYPGYDDACYIDRNTAESILSNDTEQLLNTLAEQEKAGTPGLSTCLCGWTSVLTLMNITRKISGIHYTLLNYKNSGDVHYHNKSKVVGYWSISVTAGT